MNRQQHWQAAYTERYGGDLDALTQHNKREAYTRSI